jgi:hypothetical protein
VAAFITIGSASGQNPIDDIVEVVVRPGDTVKVQNRAASPNSVNYHTNGRNGGITGTLTSNASRSISAAGVHFLSATKRVDLILSGGIYG